jgi:hypothetical protein
MYCMIGNAILTFLTFTIPKSKFFKFQISLNKTEISWSTFESTESENQQSTLELDKKLLYQEHS